MSCRECITPKHLDAVFENLVKDPVPLLDYLAKAGTLELRDHPPRVWEPFQRGGLVEKRARQSFS